MESRGAGIDSNTVFTPAVGRKCPLKLFYLRPKNKCRALEDTSEYLSGVLPRYRDATSPDQRMEPSLRLQFSQRPGGIAGDDGSGRDIAGNHAAGAHDRILANRNSAQNC